MTTTELIELLKENEIGGISGKPRVINYIYTNGKGCRNPIFTFDGCGDGCLGPELQLKITGEWFDIEEEPEEE